MWPPGLAASWHVGSSQTRDRTCVPSIGLGIDEDTVMAEEPSVAVPDEIPRLEGDEDASCMKAVD